MFSLPSPSSWAWGQSAGDEASRVSRHPSFRALQLFSFSGLLNPLLTPPLSLYFLQSLDVSLKERAISQSEVGLLCPSLGMSTSFAQCVTQSPSGCIKKKKRVRSDEGRFRDTPPTPGRLRARTPPSLSKTQRPIFRKLSDKHHLRVERLPV